MLSMAGAMTNRATKERDKEMRKRLTLTVALGAIVALAVAGVAHAYKPVVVKAGNLVLTFNGGITPSKLPKHKMAPISLNVSAGIKTADGSHPPALKEFVVETDKNGGINAKGVPTCKAGKIEATTTTSAEKACKSAIIGKGTTDVEVLFPESAPIQIKSKLLAFNGGVSGGKTTLFIHAYLSNPIAAAIVTTVKVSKIHNGRYGLKSVASIPKIANGAGSVKTFNLTINKKGVLMAKCPDGKLQAKATGVFADGTKATGSIVRTCKGK
jgi:hypothetical protein